ncbi:MAG: hypothetical protein J6T57_00650 [Alphaproteobacteria bacterium]|nr:hypothetical protein [Alphaproteobacteria bacterium]
MNKVLGSVLGAVFIGNAMAADITLYYSPTCPHCHHAREFISQTLVYEYPELRVTAVNVMESENRPAFKDALTKCEYESGGVPVMVVGEKCFQGYGDSMADSIRDAVAADLDDAAKKVAAENKKAMESDAAAFRAAHTERADVIVEYKSDAKSADDAQKKIDGAEKSDTGWIFYAVLIALVLGLGFVLTRKGNKK